MSQEIQCLSIIAGSLESSFTYFHKGVGDPGASQLTVSQVTELFEAFSALIDSVEGPEERFNMLSRVYDAGVFSSLVSYVCQPLIFAPDVSAGFSLQQTFVQLRIASLQAINKVVIASADYPELSKKCCDAFADYRLLTGLITLMSSPATFETLRVAAIETIFIYIFRIAGGKKHLLDMRGQKSLLNCLVLEPAAMVRNYICSAIRELASDHSKELCDDVLINTMLKVISLDESPDARTLCIEVLDVCVRTTPQSGNLLTQPSEVCICIKERFERDNSPQVAEAAGKFCEMLCHAANKTQSGQFFEMFVTHHVYRALISALRHPVKAAAAAARALRFAVQYAPPNLQIGHRIISQFQTLSALLKTAMDLAQPMQNEQQATEVAQQILCVEIGMAISMILVQSPVHRQHVYRELHAFPLWTTALRSSLVNFLNTAALDYYANIELFDVTGSLLNALEGVEWSDANKPKKSSIRQIFAAQESRVREQRFERPRFAPPVTMDLEARRKMRLTFILLNYGIHLTLSSEAVSAASPHEAQSMPSMSAPPDAMLAGGGGISPRFADPMNMTGASPTPNINMVQTPRGQMQRGYSMTQGARTPMFPNPRSPRGGTADPRTAVTPKEREEMATAYDKFDSAFKLTMQFAQYYAKKQQPTAQFESTGDGYVVRQQKLRNPWGPVVQKTRLKSWTVKDLKEGDLFYFAIPFDDLRLFSVDTVMERARRHLAACKRLYITTPQSAKGRRFFLDDMMHNVLPSILELLQKLRQSVTDHGGDNVRFPLFLFREKELHLGERALHCGNLVEVLDQVQYYFSQNPSELLGVNASYVQHVQEKMRELSKQRFTGEEELSPVPSDDEEGGFAGHGGISSDSDG